MRHVGRRRRTMFAVVLGAAAVMGWSGGTMASAGPITPRPAVAGLRGVTAVSSGIGFSVALLNTGQVYAWGANNVGQLGDGNTTASATPVRVRGLSHVKAISAGGFSSVALLDSGGVMAWGDNQVGQLGDGTIQ